MRVGTDGRKLPRSAELGAVGALERAAALGADGLFFRTILDMSPTLDPGELRAIRDKASELGMYLETGLAKVNPFALAEAPEVRAIGGGDTLHGFRRMIGASAGIGCTELWAATANYKPQYRGRFCYDRFRTDVTWEEQLAATGKLLERLKPFAREFGVHINLETHEEITSFELVRLVEKAGPDVFGVVFDTANVLQRIEHPVWAARRLAPYVRQTHVKDASLTTCDGGLAFHIRTCGEGMVDFRQILPLLARENDMLNLTVENQQVKAAEKPPKPMLVEIGNSDFLAGHPDLTPEEHEAFTDLIASYAERIRSGEREDWETVASGPHDVDRIEASIVESMKHLRAVCEELGLPVQARRNG